jgi:hypothetical protein
MIRARTKLELMLFALLGIGGIAFYYAWRHHQREIGAEQVLRADAEAAAKREKENAAAAVRDKQVNEDAVHELQAERDRLAASLAAIPAPVIRVCPSPRSGSGLPSTAGTAIGAGQTPTPGGNVPEVPTGAESRDIGPQLRDAFVVAERIGGLLRAMQARERGFHEQ